MMVTARGTPAAGPPRPGFDALLKRALRQYQFAADADRKIREEALEDLKFYAGDQWPQQIKADRDLSMRPCLTINRLPVFARQVINAQRAGRPGIQINPVGDGADVDTAQIIQGLVRHIEVNSDAEIAYDTAFEHAVIMGFGYWRILTDFIDDDSFDQEIIIEAVENPFSVYLDPSSRKRDGRDMHFAFVVDDIPFEIYREEYGESTTAGLSNFKSIGDQERDWFQNGNVRVAEYFWVERQTKWLVRLADGTSVPEDQLTEYSEIDSFRGQPVRRQVRVPQVYWCKMNAREILEPEDRKPQLWPGRTIPIVPVYGDKLIVEGRKKLSGMVRHSKDAQRMYNYARTGIVEQIALASKSPWIMAEGQAEGHEEEWKQSNVRTTAVLFYKSKNLGNQLVPPPMRNAYEPPIQALTQSLVQSDLDLKGTTGMYDANLGERGPEESGKAILARKEQGEHGTAHFVDNLSRSIREGGRKILDLLPWIYDAPRVVRIVKPDQTHDLVQINEPFDENGVQRLYDVTSGRYDVTVSAGTSFQTRRKEFVEAVMALVQAAPQIMQFVLDLLVRNMDWPGASEIADRLKKMLPPQLQDKQEGEEGQPQVPPEMQAKLAALLQQNAMLLQELQAAKSGETIRRLQIESNERIQALHDQTNMLIAELKLGSTEALKLADLHHRGIEHRLELLHDAYTIEQDAAQQEAELAQRKAEQDAAAQAEQQPPAGAEAEGQPQPEAPPAQ